MKKVKTRHNLSAEEQKIFEEFLEGKVTKAQNFNILLQAISEHRVNTDKIKKAGRKRNREFVKKYGKEALQ